MGVIQYYTVRDIHNRKLNTARFRDILPLLHTEKNVNNFLYGIIVYIRI